ILLQKRLVALRATVFPRETPVDFFNFSTSYAPCLRHGPVALASSQTQPHFVRLGPRYSTQCFIPDPTSL
ncbi:hypothetical protein E4T56_gene14252, partial [Termitomyces sp. T112]